MVDRASGISVGISQSSAVGIGLFAKQRLLASLHGKVYFSEKHQKKQISVCFKRSPSAEQTEEAAMRMDSHRHNGLSEQTFESSRFLAF